MIKKIELLVIARLLSSKRIASTSLIETGGHGVIIQNTRYHKWNWRSIALFVMIKVLSGGSVRIKFKMNGTRCRM